MDAEKEMEISKGSTYRIRFGEKESFEGVFKGYSMIGSETSVVMESDGTLVYIPVGVIVSITLIKAGKKDAQKKKDEPGVYYG